MSQPLESCVSAEQSCPAVEWMGYIMGLQAWARRAEAVWSPAALGAALGLLPGRELFFPSYIHLAWVAGEFSLSFWSLITANAKVNGDGNMQGCNVTPEYAN